MLGEWAWSSGVRHRFLDDRARHLQEREGARQESAITM